MKNKSTMLAAAFAGLLVGGVLAGCSSTEKVEGGGGEAKSGCSANGCSGKDGEKGEGKSGCSGNGCSGKEGKEEGKSGCSANGCGGK